MNGDMEMEIKGSAVKSGGGELQNRQSPACGYLEYNEYKDSICLFLAKGGKRCLQKEIEESLVGLIEKKNARRGIIQL